MTTQTPSSRTDDLELLRLRLLEHAALFDAPGIYAAGVEDAIDAVLALPGSEGEDGPTTRPRNVDDPRMSAPWDRRPLVP